MSITEYGIKAFKTKVLPCFRLRTAYVRGERNMQSSDHASARSAYSRAFRHVIIDVETTGLRPGRGGRVIEVGAVAVEKQEVVGEFHSLVRINRRVPLQARRIHGISDEMLVGQPTAEEVFLRMHSFAGDAVFVAHNAVFDLGFLRYEFGRLGLGLPNRCLCTLEMSRRRYPQLRDHKLETVYRFLCGEPAGSHQRHRALDDARMAARVWMEMMGR